MSMSISSYQQLLQIAIVHKLVSRELESYRGHVSNKLELVNVQDTYYLRNTKGDLIKIDKECNILSKGMRNIFETVLFYIEHHDDPYAIFFISSYDNRKHDIHNINSMLLNILYQTRPTIQSE